MKKWKKTMIVFCLAAVSSLAFIKAGNMHRAEKNGHIDHAGDLDSTGNEAKTDNKKNIADSSRTGKTPGCYQCTFGDDYLLYKGDVLVDGEKLLRGLYRKDLKEGMSEKAVLVADDYYACANVHGDRVIYISNSHDIVSADLQGKDRELLVGGEGKHVSDALVIGDILYFLSRTEKDEPNESMLFALDLNSHMLSELAGHVSFRYLYCYQGTAGVISKEDGRFLSCSIEQGIVREFDQPEREIMGFLKDGSVICYEDGTVYAKDSLSGQEDTKLFKKDDIYRIIVHSQDLLVCTLDEYGLIEVFIYDFAQKQLDKIANADFVPRDYNEHYVVC